MRLEEEEGRRQAMVERSLHTLQAHLLDIPARLQVGRHQAIRARQSVRLQDTAVHRRPMLVRREHKDQDQGAHRPTLQHLRDRVCIFFGHAGCWLCILTTSLTSNRVCRM